MTAPPPDSGPFLEALQALDGALRENGTPYMLIGGFAVAAHGHPRPTADLDATVWDPKLQADRLLHALASHEIRPRVPPNETLNGRMLLLVHAPSDTPIDLSLALLPEEAEMLQRAVRSAALGIEVPVVALDDLLFFKAIAMRPHDQADIEKLAHIHHGAFDAALLAERVGVVHEIMGTPERTAILDALLARVARGLPRG